LIETRLSPSFAVPSERPRATSLMKLLNHKPDLTTRRSPNAPDARDPKGLGFLSANDVARAVRYMVQQPKHAAVDEIGDC
jgi:NADP-dependent 3-hydroxy acid dehydrogenase YdfG